MLLSSISLCLPSYQGDESASTLAASTGVDTALPSSTEVATALPGSGEKGGKGSSGSQATDTAVASASTDIGGATSTAIGDASSASGAGIPSVTGDSTACACTGMFCRRSIQVYVADVHVI